MASTGPKLKTRLVSNATACDALGICAKTFQNHWSHVFTDPRDKEDRRRGVARRVFEDELSIAVESGGGTSSRAKAAVANYRALIKRTW